MERTAPRELLRRVGRRVAELRAQCGLTQEAFATALGIATKNLQRIESGRQNLTLASLDAIASRLGVEAQDLLSQPVPDDARPRVARTAWLEGLAACGVELQDEPGPGTLPVTPLQAAAEHLARAEAVPPVLYAKLTGRSSRTDKGTFVARVLGGSMAPWIPDGGWCVFRAPASLNVLGGIALLSVRESTDQTRYVVRRVDRAAGKRARLRIESLAPGFAERDVAPADASVLAELVTVLSTES